MPTVEHGYDRIQYTSGTRSEIENNLEKLSCFEPVIITDENKLGYKNADGVFNAFSAKGDTGIQGPKGPIGDIGPQGIQGIKGDKGDIGIQGPKGETSLVNNTNGNVSVKMWFGTTDEYNSLTKKEDDTFYAHFLGDGSYVGKYFKKKPQAIKSGLIEHFDFADGKGTEATLKSRVSENVLTLSGFNFDENSGWTGKGLKFDGVDDNASLKKKLSEVIANKNNVTIIITKASFLDDDTQPIYVEGLVQNSAYFFVTNSYSKSGISANKLITSKNGSTFAFVKSGGTGNIYTDGVFDVGGTSSDSGSWGERTIVLGVSKKWDTGTISSYGKTEIYSFKIYDRPLTAEEVYRDYEYEQSIDRTSTQMLPDNSSDLSYGIGLSNQLSDEQKASFRLSLDDTKFVAGMRYCEGLEVVRFTYADVQLEMEKEEWASEEVVI